VKSDVANVSKIVLSVNDKYALLTAHVNDKFSLFSPK
jgi:hypothetical protein